MHTAESFYEKRGKSHKVPGLDRSRCAWVWGRGRDTVAKQSRESTKRRSYAVLMYGLDSGGTVALIRQVI